ncbi:hypothetical protein GDO81_004093, partial [Engystomops pustulosus]
MGRFCGPKGSRSHPGHRRFASYGNRMKIEFHSDFSNEENGLAVFYKGFQAFYQAVGNNGSRNCLSESPEDPNPTQRTRRWIVNGRVCGQPENPVTRLTRVINGKEAQNGNFPWQAYLKHPGPAGGVLIGEKWVLTAAHVLKSGSGRKDLDVNDLHLFLGDVHVDNLLMSGL